MRGSRIAPAGRLRRLLVRVRRHGLRLLVLGIGNEMLGDDAIGHLLARDLASIASDGFLSVSVGVAIENAAHLVRRHRADVLVLIDAADGIGGSAWGFVRPSRLDSFCHSTHSVPLSLLVTTWQDEHPDLDVHFIGVRPVSNEFGAPLSDGVAAARTEIVAIFRESLAGSERPAEEQRG
ncbi:MAG: hydrogenase maturation protease [Thermoanaerobaculaceae bacterium]